MDKNTVIGFILIGLIMFGFMGYQSKQYRKQLEAQAQIDSLAQVEAARQDSIRQAYLREHPEDTVTVKAVAAVSEASHGIFTPFPLDVSKNISFYILYNRIFLLFFQ